MTKTLILGGTGWLGREIATQLVALGDDVICLARGESGPAADGARLIRADRNDADAYDVVCTESWDDVIELSSEPAMVAGALAKLAAVASHWTLVSTVSVYASHKVPGANETAELLEPVDRGEYGQQKVAAERVSLLAVGDRLLIARPGLIAGPGDDSDRFGYWVGRFALAGDGPVLCPLVADRDVQVIDVRDLAGWMIRSGRGGLVGTIDAVGDRHSLGEMLDAAADAAGYTGTRVEASDDWMKGHGVEHWAGSRSLPLWLPVAASALMKRDNSAFHRAGGVLRNLASTLADTLADERRRGLERGRQAGLTRADELTLIALR
ncbi:MAG: NAD-dependent epimerase/dehydratase family protein [Actinomycetota bacterium]